MTTKADEIAHAVLTQFAKLPKKRKPLVRDNGLHEWVPLSGIVAEQDGEMTCLALATGMKCLPSAKLSKSNGVAVHDWHAEILAIRAFNRFLFDECLKFPESYGVTGILQKIDPLQASALGVPPFSIKDGVKLHMYCSEAPCGDASMELTMNAQDDATPWTVPIGNTVTQRVALPGRAFFSELGAVRLKPGRGDAPPTLSKSCSDKIAMKQCTSLLSSLVTLCVDPTNAYIDTLVLPRSQYTASGCTRAFSPEGRMHPMIGRHWSGGYKFKPFAIEATDVEFEFSKRSVQARSSNISASGLAAAWSLSEIDETLIGGIIQGRRAYEVKGASKVSKIHMLLAISQVVIHLDSTTAARFQDLAGMTYREIKDGPLLTERRAVKADVRSEALVGWTRNEEGSDFNISHMI